MHEYDACSLSSMSVVILLAALSRVLCLTPNFSITMRFVWLQESVARTEQQLADYEAALVEEKIVCQEKKRQAEQFQYQVDIFASILLFFIYSPFVLFFSPDPVFSLTALTGLWWHILCLFSRLQSFKLK